MAFCSSCGTGLAEHVRFCPACGTAVANTDNVPTLDASKMDLPTAISPLPPRPASQRPSSSSSSRPPSSSAEYLLNEGRFLPGRLVASRYRIIALLGKGGMGEVYRADDLTLGQAVAMKFLPDEAGRDEAMLERFRNEVRMARRVSHPNVCRVYDVGDVDGQIFFTMEYVDGEDLASLLRRIGRLPQDKAVEIARQLCAGLAAAHAKGVLHRDLKPANIMLDGRGQVVITDFGLAGVSDSIRGPEVRSGTPAYMAPEQLEGREVTMRSDIYGLGLVLYEVFTGKRAFAEKPAGALHRHGDHTPSRPSSVVKDLDPIVEKVILRCLESDPAARPANALAIAAALPGGDPLAAALAAGETPSPQMVAAAGETTGLRPRVAVPCLVAILIGLGIGAFLTIRYGAIEKIHPDQPPEVLAHKAREIIAQAGYTEKPSDWAYGFDFDTDYQNALEKEKVAPNWNAVLAGRPNPLLFWYRQSPDSMIARGYRDFFMTPDIVVEEDPPTTLSGMVNVKIDARGRLIYFQAIPPQKEAVAATAEVKPDWSALFAAADVDVTRLQPARPQWNSFGAADVQAAWTGVWPGSTRPLRVEAAALHGKPVFFAMIGDWNTPWRMVDPSTHTAKNWLNQVFTIIALGTLLGGGGLLARKQYRTGRADREGAFRVGVVMFVLQMMLAFSRSHVAADPSMLFVTLLAIAGALFVGATVWVVYVAVEPWIRKRWPQAMISWSRLLSGQLRDAVVGRDILFGVSLGVLWILIFELAYIPAAHAGVSPTLGSTAYLLGGREAFGQWLTQIPISIFITLQFFFLAFGLRYLLRKDWLAAIAFVLIYVGVRSLGTTHPAIDLPTFFLVYVVLVVIIFRFGLVPLAVAAFTVDMLANVPFTADFSAWYAGATLLALFSVVGLAVWGFYHSLGGKPVWVIEPE